MDETRDLLTNELETEIQKLSMMESGSEEKSAAIDGIQKLYKVKIEDIRTEAEIQARLLELEAQKEERKIDRFFNGAMKAASGVGFLVTLIVVSYTEYKGGYFGSTIGKLMTKKIR